MLFEHQFIFLIDIADTNRFCFIFSEFDFQFVNPKLMNPLRHPQLI